MRCQYNTLTSFMKANENMNAERSFHHQRRPPDVEEALSSMLWTPYERTSTDSSSDEDDQRMRPKRLHFLHNSYDHRITYEPITSTYFGDDDEMGSTAAVTTPASANVANSLQCTPFVPFSNFIYNNNNNNDDASCSRNHCNSMKINSSRKQSNAFRSGGFRFSYPYYGPIASLNKWRTPSVSSKEPPSYDSLYAKGPVAPVVFEVCDSGFKDLKGEANTGKEEPLQDSDAFDFERARSLQSLGQIDFETGKLLSSTSENAAFCIENESHIELENRCNNNNIDVATDDQSNGAKAVTTTGLSEKPPTNGRSQQTEEYNNNKTNSNNSEEDDDVSRENRHIQKLHQQMQLPRTSSQSNATARTICIAMTGVTDKKSTKNTERARTTSHGAEEISEPVSCIDNSKNSLPASNLRTHILNNHSNKNSHIALSISSMNNDACPNNGIRMNATTMNALTNLFDASWSDKATTGERAYGRYWESVYTENHTAPTVVDAVAIIQSATCAFNGRISTHKSRSSFITLPSYAYLWKKTINGVRTKVKRVSRPSSEGVNVPSAPPLDTLTPNKCLAELERLYAEFQASESALAAARDNDSGRSSTSRSRSLTDKQCFSPSHNNSGDSDFNCNYKCELLSANSSKTTNITDSANKMRLNIPAAKELQPQQINTVNVLAANSTSSVFLTSSDCAAIRCITSDDRPKDKSVNGDDRCSNLLHETKNNYGDCVNNLDNHKINNNNEDDDVGFMQNDYMSINNETVAMISPSVNRSKSSLTIQVNSANSDQNNNSNCTNKNNFGCNDRNNYHEDNDCISVEASLVNLCIGKQQTNIVKSNGVYVVNCNYSNVFTINNGNSINSGQCNLSATNTKPITPTSVRSLSVNESVNQVSPVPNVLCNGKKSTSSDNIADVNTAKNCLNSNEINTVHVTDKVNIISLSAQSQTTQNRTPHASSTSTCVSLTRSETTSALSSQRVDASLLQACASIVASEQSRTFASTECQTEEFLPLQLRTDRAPVSPISQRAHRRRHRWERRHLQQQLSSYSQSHQLRVPSPLRHSVPPGSVPITSIGALHIQSNAYHSAGSLATTMPAAMSALLRPMLPDLLHRHFPPPYSALPLNGCPAAAVTSPTMVGSVPPTGATILTPVISTVPMPVGAPPVVSDGRFTLPLPIIRRSPSERSGKGCCGHWFAGPPLRALIAVVALGGVTCALGGAALGAIGLAGPPSSHLTAALLMIGVGVVLVTVSGAAWRMTAPGGPPCLGLGSAVDLGRCGRRTCGRGGGTAHGLLYPEFQHRPPPPSYQASMQEYRLRLLLLDRDRQNGIVRGNSPPPTYRSYVGSLLRAPITTAIRREDTTGSVADISEYNLPPSYRLRNTSTAIIANEGSTETAISNRLLANENIPEPSIEEQLSNTESTFRTLPERSSGSTRTMSTILQKDHQQHQYSRRPQLRTSAIIEMESAGSRNNQSHSKSEQEVIGTTATRDLSFTSHKDLVTIVTISKRYNEEDMDLANRGEHSEILAHL